MRTPSTNFTQQLMVAGKITNFLFTPDTINYSPETFYTVTIPNRPAFAPFHMMLVNGNYEIQDTYLVYDEILGIKYQLNACIHNHNIMISLLYGNKEQHEEVNKGKNKHL
ncbi:MAG: hypothetical protein H0X33_07445 [Taibaiella sp.]|nr:hypothetical protein [Taibaiella sp.]